MVRIGKGGMDVKRKSREPSGEAGRRQLVAGSRDTGTRGRGDWENG